MNGATADPTRSGESKRPRRRRWPALLLVIPLVGTLVPEFYNHVSPRIGGMPFFYWYQLAWIAISVTVTYGVYRATRLDDGSRG